MAKNHILFKILMQELDTYFTCSSIILNQLAVWQYKVKNDIQISVTVRVKFREKNNNQCLKKPVYVKCLIFDERMQNSVSSHT